MKANETKIENFLSQNKTQFIIPIYQRNYDWGQNQCEQLLNDILEIGNSKEKNVHFIGSIVYVCDDVYTSSRIKELVIIDGQQRLTTLTLIYIALHHFAIESNDETLKQEISETYLTNKFTTDEEKLKLRPAGNNDEAIKHLINGNSPEEFKQYSKIIDNFNYYRKHISEHNLEIIRIGLSKLMFVEISLEREKDNPQRIFESLNSTGLDLSQADLIRNYILMDLRPNVQKKIFSTYWEVIEKLAIDNESNISKVSDFIRDYLTLTNKKIPNKNKVYEEFKSNFPPRTLEILETNLSSIKFLAKFYNKLVNPENESDKDIRRGLNYIKQLEMNVSYPFLMKVYSDFDQDIINKKTFMDILEFIQSFIWRRFIVGLQTNALNKIFMTLYEKIDHENYLTSLQQWLLKRSGAQRFPSNHEILESLKFKDMYNIKSKNRTYMLERLENFKNKEPVMIEGNKDITIEHIFPQNPDPKWYEILGEKECIFIKETYLNTIGNLTLSGNNGKLGNKIFIEKRDLEDAGYKDSRLWLNTRLSTAPKWDTHEIESRFNLLADRFLEIWQFPEIDLNLDDQNTEINIFDAEEPKYKKLEYIIFLNQKIEITQVSDLYKLIFTELFNLNAELFFRSDLGQKISLATEDQVSKLRQAVPISDLYFIEGNMDNIGKFEKIKYALTIFNLTEELIIKYSACSSENE